jgi:hypothetical protein
MDKGFLDYTDKEVNQKLEVEVNWLISSRLI